MFSCHSILNDEAVCHLSVCLYVQVFVMCVFICFPPGLTVSHTTAECVPFLLTLQPYVSPPRAGHSLLQCHIHLLVKTQLYAKNALLLSQVKKNDGSWLQHLKLTPMESVAELEEDHRCDMLMSQLPQLYVLNFLFEEHS